MLSRKDIARESFVHRVLISLIASCTALDTLIRSSYSPGVAAMAQMFAACALPCRLVLVKESR